MDNREHRVFIIVFTLVPFIAFLFGCYLLVQGEVATSDWISLGVMYCVAGFGVSTGYHRLLAHRAFATPWPLRYAFAAAGAIAGQGPPIIWVAHHRKHHRNTDKPGDPHSPYDVNDPGRGLTFAGFWNSHVTWLFSDKLTSEPIRYCPDLLRDKGLRVISNHFVFFVVAGILLGGVIGGLVSGTVGGFFSGMLWGGLIRIFLGNNATYAVNSVGHTAGPRRYLTAEESRNVAWLAIPSFGEAWHNNHHAFPRSASHGMRWYEIDISAMTITVLEKLGLASDVVRIDRETQEKVAANWRDRGGGRAAPASPQRPLASLKSIAMPHVTDVE